MAHKHSLMGRILAMLLAAAMIVTSVPEAALTVRAEEDTTIVDESANVDEAADESIAEPDNEGKGAEEEISAPAEESVKEEAPAEETEGKEEKEPVAEATEDVKVEISEADEAGDNVDSAIVLAKNALVSGAGDLSSTPKYFKYTMSEGKVYFLRTKGAYTVNVKKSDGAGPIDVTSLVNAVPSDASEKYQLLGIVDETTDVLFEVTASGTVSDYTLGLYETSAAYTLEAGDAWGLKIKAAFEGFTDDVAIAGLTAAISGTYEVGASGTAKSATFKLSSDGQSLLTESAVITDYKVGDELDDIDVTITLGTNITLSGKMEKPEATSNYKFEDECEPGADSLQPECTITRVDKDVFSTTTGSVKAYYRETGAAEGEAYSSVSAELSASSDRKTLTASVKIPAMGKLKPETKYDVYYEVMIDFNVVYVSQVKQYTTAEDPRKITDVDYEYDTYYLGMTVSYSDFTPINEYGSFCGFMRAFYKEQGSEEGYSYLGDYQYVDSSSGTASFSLSKSELIYGKPYDYVIAVTDNDSYASFDKWTVLKKGTFDAPSVPSVPIKINKVSVTPGAGSARFLASCYGDDDYDEEAGNRSYQIYYKVFHREKKDGEDTGWSQTSSWSWMSGNGSGTYILTDLSGLAGEAEYEYAVVCASAPLNHLSSPADAKSAPGYLYSDSGSFKTNADQRKLDDVKVQAGITTAKITASFSGGDVDRRTWFSLFTKEGDYYSYIGYGSSDDPSGDVPIYLRRTLKAGEKYEYILVMNGSDVTSYSEEGKYLGTKTVSFTTMADTRTIKSAEVEAFHSSAELAVTFAGGSDLDTTKIVSYYRKKGTDRWHCEELPYIYKASDVAYHTLTELESGATYEYVVTVWNYTGADHEEYVPGDKNDNVVYATETKEFTTPAEGRTVGDVTVKAGITRAEMKVPFSGAIDGEKTYAYFYFRKKGDESYPGYRQTSELVDEGILELTRTGLTKETEYEYIVLVSGQDFGGDYIDPTQELTSDAMKAYGVFDKKTGSFKTAAESRKIVVADPVVSDATYDSVELQLGYTDSYEGERTRMALFYREKGKEGADYQKAYMYCRWYIDPDESENGIAYWEPDKGENLSWTYDKLSYFAKLYYDDNDLKAGKTYECILVLSADYNNINDLTEDKDDIIAQKEFTFTTLAEGRKLKASTITATGYTTINIKTGYEGNVYKDAAYVAVYVREVKPEAAKPEGDESETVKEDYECIWKFNDGEVSYLEACDYAYDYYGNYTLKSGTQYEYVIVYTDHRSNYWLSDNALKEMKEAWVSKGTFTTKSADFDVKITHNPEASTADTAALDVELTGASLANNDNVIKVQLGFKRADADETVSPFTDDTYTVLLKNSGDGYKGTVMVRNLVPGTKYVVAYADLYAYEGKAFKEALIKTLEKEGGYCTFTTKSSAVTSVTLSAQDVYLNSHGDYWMDLGQMITATVAPATAETSFVVVPDDPEKEPIATVSSYARTGTMVIQIDPVPYAVGDMTFNVMSATESPTKLASFNVHVVDYALAEVPAEGNEPDPRSYYSIPKGSEIGPMTVYSREEGSYKKVDGDITMESGLSVASWSSDNKLYGTTFGRSYVTFRIGNYPVKVLVDVTKPYDGFIINKLIGQEGSYQDCYYDPYYDEWRGVWKECYPAIITEGPVNTGMSATIAADARYQMAGYLAPQNVKLDGDTIYGWLDIQVTNSADDRLTADADGYIRAGSSDKPYDAEITVTAKPVDGAEKPWTEQKAVIKLHVLPLPKTPSDSYAFTNLASTLADVTFDGDYTGWAWDEPDTALYLTSQSFSATYTGADHYPLSEKIGLTTVTLDSVIASAYPYNVPVIGDSSDPDGYVVELRGEQAEMYLGATACCVYNSYGDKRSWSLEYLYDWLLGDSKCEVSLTGDKTDGVQIGEYKDAKIMQEVKFTKSGDYGFTIALKSKSGNDLVSKQITVKVVSEAQVADIKIKSVTLDDSAKTKLEEKAEDRVKSRKCYEVSKAEDAEKGLVLTVETTNYRGKVFTGTKLEWTSSDTKVATISVDETTRVVTIKSVGEGHAVITAKADDVRGQTFEFKFRYQDKTPKVNKSSVNVNVAFDTDTDDGKFLAYNYKSYVQISPVYGEKVEGKNIKLYRKTAKTWDAQSDKTLVPEFSFEYVGADDYTDKDMHDNVYLVKSTPDAAKGTYKLWMVVTTQSGDFAYPLTIKAANKAPKNPSVKVTGKLNLFYNNKADQAYVVVTAKDVKDWDKITVKWEDNSEDIGFGLSRDESKSLPTKGKYYYGITSRNVKLSGTAPADSGILSGTLTVKHAGYRGDGIAKKIKKIKTFYKVPELVVDADYTTFVKEAGFDRSYFKIYNKTETPKKGKKAYLSYCDTECADNWDEFTSIVSNTDGLRFDPAYSSSEDVWFSYNGIEDDVTFSMTLDSPSWREPITVNHTAKSIEPEAELSNDTIETNSALDELYITNTRIRLKDFNGTVEICDVKIEGEGNTEKELLAKNFIDVYSNNNYDYRNVLVFNQNAVKALGGSLAAGTYKFKITPYYATADGKNIALNEVTLTILVHGDAMEAKTISGGTMDIAKRSMHKVYKDKNGKGVASHDNEIKVDTEFLNMPTGYDAYTISPRLKGEFADCFELYSTYDGWYIRFNGSYNSYLEEQAMIYESFNDKLKAGMSISLSIDYTIRVPREHDGGNYYEYYEAAVINGGEFTITTKQSAPRIKMTGGKNQVLYASASVDQVDDRKNYVTGRYVTFAVPVGYRIDSIDGELDYNNDNTPEIEVYQYGSSWVDKKNRYVKARIYIADMDKVAAETKGKALTIPVKVRLAGADGYVKKSEFKIKIKVKK